LNNPQPLKPSAIADIFKIFEAANPNPQTELAYKTPYTLLVAVVLSAQATDKGVNKATQSLFQRVSTPEEMCALGEEGLKNYIKTIGLYNTKAKNIIKLSEILVRDHEGQVPHNRDALEALPGVGRKTANVVLNVVFGDETIAVDTHIFRVANRTGLSAGKTPLAVEKDLLKVIPKAYLPHAHHWLVLHGRYTCQARRPLCFQCNISKLCKFLNKTSL
jgi:endonuclease-3